MQMSTSTPETMWFSSTAKKFWEMENEKYFLLLFLLHIPFYNMCGGST